MTLPQLHHGKCSPSACFSPANLGHFFVDTPTICTCGSGTERMKVWFGFACRCVQFVHFLSPCLTDPSSLALSGWVLVLLFLILSLLLKLIRVAALFGDAALTITMIRLVKILSFISEICLSNLMLHCNKPLQLFFFNVFIASLSKRLVGVCRLTKYSPNHRMDFNETLKNNYWM